MPARGPLTAVTSSRNPAPVSECCRCAVIAAVVLVVGCGGTNKNDDGPDQPSSPMLLTRSDSEPAGSRCPRGGVAVHAGLDRNGDGKLEDSEIDDTEYICDPPRDVLVRKDSLPPGTTCPTGGTIVQIGVDDNDDGVLEDSEIDQGTTLCNSSELWSGDFTAVDWGDPAKVAALQGAHIVTGSLSLAGQRSIALPLLQVVSGNVTVTAGGVVSLPALVTIGGDLTLQANTVALELGALQSVLGKVDVATTDDLFAFTLPALKTIGDDLHVTARGLSSISLPALENVAGNFEIGSLSQCGTVDTCSDGNCLLSFLTDVSLPRVDRIDGCVVIDRAVQMATLELGARRIGGALVLHEAFRSSLPGAASTLSAPSLASIEGSAIAGVAIRCDQTGLDTFALPSLVHVNGDISISDNLKLRDVQFLLLESDAPAGTGIKLFDNPPLSRVSAPRAGALTELRVDQALITPDAPPLTLDYGHLQDVALLHLFEVSISDLSGLSSLRQVGALELTHVGQLTNFLGFVSLSELQRLVLLDTPALTSLDGLEQLTHLNVLSISSSPALTSIAGLGNVTEVGLSVRLSDADVLTAIALTHLQSIGGALTVQLRSLTSLSGLGALRALGGMLSLDADHNPLVPPEEIAELRARLGK
jgi:hypothetical protein